MAENFMRQSFKIVIFVKIKLFHFCTVKMYVLLTLLKQQLLMIRFTILVGLLSLVGWTTSNAQNNFSAQSPCGFQISMTAVGTNMIGSVNPISNGTNFDVMNVVWRNMDTEEILGYGQTIDAAMPYGNYNVKTNFTVFSANGLSCSGQLVSHLAVIEPECVQPFSSMVVNGCGSTYAPVCGCDGIDYLNECAAYDAGVSRWWAGECATQPAVSDCGTTDLEFELLGGNPTDGFDVKFINLAAGQFTNLQIDFGDGSPLHEAAQWNEVIHHYNEPGLFRATLTAWRADATACISSVARTIATDSYTLLSGDAPIYSEYVLPGDADGSQRANVYDLLKIGQGYGVVGVPRPEASIEWAAQYAPKWAEIANDGVNLKHSDTNGDGLINDFDIEALELNYQPINISVPPIEVPPLTYSPALPSIRVEFADDTLSISQSGPVQIQAELVVGQSTQPVFGLYGVAGAMRYPDFVNHNPSFGYDPALLGSPNFVVSMNQDFHDQFQLDFGVSRKNGQGANGHGNLATVTFSADYIIIIDIIDRAESKIIPFVVPLEGIKAIDPQGNEILLSAPPELDTLWIKNNLLNSTKGRDLEAFRAEIFPNPTDQSSIVRTQGVSIERVVVRNAMGQTVYETYQTGGETAALPTAQWPQGHYAVQVATAKGVVERRLQVQR
jgi:PKD domain